MKFSSVLKKGYLMSWLKFKLWNFMLYGNMYYIGPILKNPKRCLFYFPFYEFMHYGDHLFFEPVMQFMRQNDIEVVVCPIPAMQFYFTSLGYKIIDAKDVDFRQVDLVISRVELYPHIKKISRLLMVKINHHKITAPFIQDMVNKVARLIKKTSIVMPAYAPYNATDLIPLQQKYNLNPEKSYIVVNTYVDSGSYSVLKKHKEYILHYVENYLKSNACEVILTGSLEDKKNDVLEYNFPYLDLRGKTTIPEIFALMQIAQVKAYIGFDGLLMHLANMYDKPSFVLVRKSTELYWGADIIKFVMPFVTNTPLVTIINN